MRASVLLCMAMTWTCQVAIGQFLNDSISVAGNPQFKMNEGRYFWFGKNYRQEWVTPVNVPVINLSTIYGGLTPLRVGGGKQTKTLRLEDARGNKYSLRTIEKFITQKTIPIDLRSDALVDMVADGVSASYPYAALSVPVFARAADVPFLKVQLVYVGDDPKLSEFGDFKNRLLYLEEHTPAWMDKAYDTEEVIEKLQSDHDHKVDQKALLRARVLDMFIMDFDRHEDQWRWSANEKEGKGKIFFAVPKDRDQAFYINEGVFPSIAQWPWIAPQLEGMKPRAKNISRFNFSNRHFDRFFLNELTEHDWRATAEKLLSQMTDSVIESAFLQQPAEIRDISSCRIISTLKERRKYLVNDMMEYYRFLSEIVNIPASNQDEWFEVTRHPADSVTVTVHRLDKSGEVKGQMYRRTFYPIHTDELRLYGLGGNDRFTIRGDHDKIRLRIIGGEGKDTYENTSTERGGRIYDLKSGNNIVKGSFKNKFSSDTAVNIYDRQYFRYNQLIPLFSAGFNIDDGIYLGGSLRIIRQGFRKKPYKSSHSFSFKHALATKALSFHYNSDFIGVLGKKYDLVFDADLQAPEIINFFGFGENTVYDKTAPGKFRYYRARFSLLNISAMIRKDLTDNIQLNLGPHFQYFTMDSADSFNRTRYIVRTEENGLSPQSFNQGQHYLGGRLNLNADFRDHFIVPTKGSILRLDVKYLKGIDEVQNELTQYNGDFTFYLPLLPKVIVLANRTGFGHTAGSFEFYQAQFLGNEDNLRGYRKTRFAGRTKVFNNTELRIALSRFHTYLFPGALGIMGFYDAGKIWAPGDPSDRLLSSYGGGIWFAPWLRAVINFTYAVSKEDKMPLVSLTWKF